ncbi:DNA polymerase alpha catalytic subunit [Lolium perenne]|uniref:DNA polymerase alpha catalytic subunit n=1 Tax=Lolium perenne TaxID=4522 RepID=UPI0021EB4D26|nr:DNA polymerase alpha catalytic subunit [Lolium perenne]
MEDPPADAAASASGRRLRTRGAEAAAPARSAALERIRARREGGARAAAVQVRMEDPIYDTVAEEDYAALVARRRRDAGAFIIDDDGLGYVDDGREEDWTHRALPSSSDEGSGGEDGAAPRKRKQPRPPQARRPPQQSAAAASLSAAAAMMGKQRLSSMFTSSVFKKPGSDRAPAADSIVDDVIAEFAPDENDREERRRRVGRISAPTPLPPPVAHINKPVKAALYPEMEVRSDNNGFEPDVVSDHGNDMDVEPIPEVELKPDVEMQPKSEATQGSSTELADVSKNLEELKQEANGEVKVEKAHRLNAKIKAEGSMNRDVSSATAGWMKICGEGENAGGAGEAAADGNVDVDESSEFELKDGALPFYILDAYEEPFGINSGTVYLFGKVQIGKGFHSCCVVVKNMQRCIYAIPSSSVFPRDAISRTEKNSTNSDALPLLRATLHELASGLKSEVAEKLSDLNISNFVMTPVKRNYAFERTDIPTGEQYVLKINYPYKDTAVPSDLRGEHFHALLGTNNSALELFLVKRKIKGPTWLSISKFVTCPSTQRVSWCKFEVTVDCPKDISVLMTSAALEVPPAVVAAVNLKTIINEKHNVHEIVSASVICCHRVKIDSPMRPEDWQKRGMISHFTVMRKLEGSIFPIGLNKEASDRNQKAGSNVLALESSERALLNRLMIELSKLDCDVLVGHNISGFDLDVLLHRAQTCKVPSSMWSKIGRLRRSIMPRLTKGNTLYGSGASPGIMSCIAGRLLCDTYLCSRDLLKEVSYSLTQLAETQLKKDRREVSPHDIPPMFQSSGTLLKLVEYGETDAWLSLELMFHLSVLPLTRQLTNISGNLWGKTLQGARAQRVEYLLLHSFHAKKFIVPDKFARNKEVNSAKRKMNADTEGANAADGVTDPSVDDEVHHGDQGKARKGPSYAGGLVLEPKKGLYDKYILLLDFNSLYPSIIQEFNICFTTVERSSDGNLPNLPTSKATGVLPELLKSLVERRRMVKKWLKTASGLKMQQLDIQQQALKLTANSMYGCLGFSNSRFFAKPLAELITLQGREILQNTVDLVQNNLNLEVIYGDTDSIMIYTGLDDISRAKAIAGKVIQEVNKKYRCLEIDLDGVYKRMLLLKKKKYAAIKVTLDGTLRENIERKGLDMVRRDWSLLSKEIGDFCLNQILSGGTCDDVIEAIHNSLVQVQEQMRNGQIELEKYIITKSLTKAPEDYPDAKNQPHVQVASRLKQNGFSGCSAGDTVPYIICSQQDSDNTHSGGIAQRARHPDELKRDPNKWMIDIDYYLSQQIHPVVSRLCASIEGTSPARLAECLGLDSSKFQSRSIGSSDQDTSTTLLSVIDNEDERYRGCEQLRLSCPSCSSAFECPPVSSLIASPSDPNEGKDASVNFWRRMRCPKCPDDTDECRVSPAMLANQIKRQADNFINQYYKGLLICDDEGCKYSTHTVNLRVIGDSERGTICPNYPQCNGRLVRQYTEADLYRQLSYFCYVLDATRCLQKLDQKTRLPFEKEFAILNQTINLAFVEIQKIRDRCAFGWVQLTDLAVSI